MDGSRHLYQVFAKKSKAEWEHVHHNINIYDCVEVGDKYDGSWREQLGQPGPGHRAFAEHGYRTKPDVLKNPDGLEEVPAMACSEWYPTRDLFGDGWSILDTALEDVPVADLNPNWRYRDKAHCMSAGEPIEVPTPIVYLKGAKGVLGEGASSPLPLHQAFRTCPRLCARSRSFRHRR